MRTPWTTSFEYLKNVIDVQDVNKFHRSVFNVLILSSTKLLNFRKLSFFLNSNYFVETIWVARQSRKIFRIPISITELGVGIMSNLMTIPVVLTAINSIFFLLKYQIKLIELWKRFVSLVRIIVGIPRVYLYFTTWKSMN